MKRTLIVVLSLTMLALTAANPLTVKASNISNVAKPLPNLGKIPTLGTIELPFNATFSESTQSVAIIFTNYTSAAWTYKGFSAYMGALNVTGQFTQSHNPAAGTITLNCGALSPANGTLSMKIKFEAGVTAGNHSFHWTYVYTAFQPPPAPPIIAEGAGATWAYIYKADLSNFNALFAVNDVRVTYPSDITPKPLGCVAAWVSDWTASAFVTTKLQYYTEGLDTSSNFVNQTSGKPVGASGIGIVSFGGPLVNPVVKYAESSATPSPDRAPIKFYSDATTFYFQYANGSSIPGANLPISVINQNEDMFLIEVYEDDNGRFIMLCYGFGWKGTYAAGKYFHTTIYPNIASYNVSWIIVKWQDTNGDTFVNNPNEGDAYTVVAQGR